VSKGRKISSRNPAPSTRGEQTLFEATVAHRRGQLEQAERLYRAVLDIDRRQFPALALLGMLKAQRGSYREAAAYLREALRLRPDDAGTHFNYGNVLLALQRFDDALDEFGKAAALRPGFAEAHLNRGNILLQRKLPEQAIASYDAAIRARANYADAFCNRGHAFEELKRFDEALASYDEALAIDGNNAQFYAARGNVLHKLRRYGQALESLDKALSIDRNNAEFHYNRANLHFELKDYQAALADYDRAFQLDPALDYLEGDRLFAKLLLCDWGNLAAERSRLVAGVAAGRAVTRPFAFLAVGAPVSVHGRCAEIFSAKEYPAVDRPLWRGEVFRHERIRLAYLSADFREHPVSYQIVGMLEHHDRARFEVTGISFGPNDGSALRKRIENAFERFVDVHDRSDVEIARFLRENEIDIAIDLMGPTQYARPGILAHRPAPVQVLYLGYPGSSGASYIDYVIADRVVISESDEESYSEKVVILPDTFLATDSKRSISERRPARAEEGLPTDAFVFCSFNNSYKLTPELFDIWMRLLTAVDGAVLWLSSVNDVTGRNLRREAAARGVAPDRIIFAGRVESNADHLARCTLADLFLDTSPFGAHSSASDALWAGVPLLTCRGSTFSGRAAESLLKACGIPELAVRSLQEYEALALNLARRPDTLGALRQRLSRNRRACPLFDTGRFTRHIEAAYLAMWERYQRHKPPARIRADWGRIESGGIPKSGEA
jgi:protein O-GlcNAc transferase